MAFSRAKDINAYWLFTLDVAERTGCSPSQIKEDIDLMWVAVRPTNVYQKKAREWKKALRNGQLVEKRGPGLLGCIREARIANSLERLEDQRREKARHNFVMRELKNRKLMCALTATEEEDDSQSDDFDDVNHYYDIRDNDCL